MGDEYLIGVHYCTAERGDKKLGMHVLKKCRMEGGQYTEIWEYVHDAAAWSAFWGK